MCDARFWKQIALSTRTHYGVYRQQLASYNFHLPFQLALTTECIRQIFRFSNCFNFFNSHSLRSVSMSVYLLRQTIMLSTRTHYGVYHSLMPSIIATKTFQLALTTECIETGLMQATEISSFNSHSLRSVSKEETLKEKQYIFSTRTLYGVYRATREFVPMFVIFQLAPATECIISGHDVFAPCSFSTRTHLRSVSPDSMR